MSDLKDLAAPFPLGAISWRVGSTTKDKSKGMALAYIDARDVMDRLDAVVGPENWRDEYTELSGFLLCRLWVRVGGEWIWKCDGAGKTDVEGEKGMVSDAFKRAAVKWGIGRYLYSVDAPWVALRDGRYIEASEMPKLNAALAKFSQPSLSQSPKPKQEEPAPRVSAPVETDTQSSRPETAISRTAVARVAAPPSRADAIPTVAPSKPRSDLTADAMIRELRGRTGAIISGRRNGKPADFESECQAHELWCGTAKTLWGTLEPMDQRRVKSEREKLESTIAETKKKKAQQRPLVHTVDPDTGEVLEAAE